MPTRHNGPVSSNVRPHPRKHMAYETFRWQDKIYDIDQIRMDIELGKIQPDRIELTGAFISNYHDLYLVQDGNIGRPPIHVDGQHALSISSVRMEEPILILYIGPKLGLISLNEEAPENDYVVVDGNHRIIAANSKGSTLSAYILSPSQSLSYASYI